MKSPRRWGALAGSLLTAVSVQAFDGENSVPKGYLLFEAPVANLSLASNSLAKGLNDKDKVYTALPGELFRTAMVIQPARKDEARRDTLEAAAASDYGAFKSGDGAWIASNFTHSEQPAVAENFKDNMMASRTRELFERYPQKLLVGRAVYHDKVILFVNYRDWPVRLHPEVYVKEGNEWRRTNVLASDETFDVVDAALKTGEVRTKR